MKLKSLEMLMESIEGFDSPKVSLEQYPTGTHIASRILYTIDTTFDDIRDKCVADLGSGSGRLTIGSALCGAHHVLGIDCDIDAINKCLDNCQQFEDNVINKIDLICADVSQELFWKRFHKCFDCVLMNPPFGTKRNKGIDMIFLKRALELSTNSVYSLHKSSTREHILRKADEWKVNAEIVAQLRYDLPKIYKFHKHSSVDIEVDFFRFTHK